jgi:hypothetical protein
MSEEITFQDITGEPVSGRFEVSEGRGSDLRLLRLAMDGLL